MPERLQKLLAAAGLASRREAESWIRAGRVTVNGRVATLGERADPETDEVRVDGEPLARETLRYWLLHKPRGVITTTSDPHAAEMGRRTVLELLPERARDVRLFPVGRLDVDSEGLLLLTNDGAVAQALLHPSMGCEKVYRVTVRGRLRNAEAERLAGGLVLEDGPMARCKVGPRRFDADRERTTFELTLREGRKRQIRRAMAQLEHPVVRLLRVRMGPIELGDLPRGAARPLTAREVRRLIEFAGTRREHARTRASSRPHS
ncbi:MAG: pseudouridine synthase [Myxococcota bacterium]|nr:pseudouridine synthase [Myxococcota bacterium]